MQNQTKLTLVKITHTLVWIWFNVVIFYMLYAVVLNKIDWRVWMGYGLVLAEGVVLAAFNYVCPLTIIAHQYSDSTRDNFDIYLPNWLARNNKLIYTAILIVIAIITIYRLLDKKLGSCADFYVNPWRCASIYGKVARVTFMINSTEMNPAESLQ